MKWSMSWCPLFPILLPSGTNDHANEMTGMPQPQTHDIKSKIQIPFCLLQGYSEPGSWCLQPHLLSFSPYFCFSIYMSLIPVVWLYQVLSRSRIFAFAVPSPWKYFSPGRHMENIAPICFSFSARPFLNPRPWDSSLSSWLCLCPWPLLPFNVFKLNYLFIVCLSLFELISMRVSILVCGVY